MLLFPLALFSQASLGPILGFNNTRYKYRIDNKFMRPDCKDVVLNVRAGAIASIPLDGKGAFFQPAIVISSNSQRSDKLTYNSGLLSFSMLAAEIPLSLLLKGPRHNNGCWFLSPGIYFGRNLSGWHETKDIAGNYIRERIDLDDDMVNGTKRGYMGARIDGGYEFRGGIAIRMFVQQALSNFANRPDPAGFRVSRKNYGLEFAYQFSLKKVPKPGEKQGDK